MYFKNLSGHYIHRQMGELHSLAQTLRFDSTEAICQETKGQRINNDSTGNLADYTKPLDESVFISRCLINKYLCKDSNDFQIAHFSLFPSRRQHQINNLLVHDDQTEGMGRVEVKL